MPAVPFNISDRFLNIYGQVCCC